MTARDSADPFADPDLIACAQIVQKGDPDRFLAAMAAPVEARAILFPIYAFNVEVARAPWVTKEPMIAQMRLQWWADVLTEIEQGGPVRRHEVATPLAGAIGPAEASVLQKVVTARELDLERAPFADKQTLLGYLDDTAGALSRAAARSLDSRSDARADALATWARAAGLVRYLQATPQLEALGKLPLPDGRPEAVAELVNGQLAALGTLGASAGLRGLRRDLGQAGSAVLEFWQAKPLLRRAAKEPRTVSEGRLAQSGIVKRAGLIWASL